jgi:hypothetical protein
MNQIFFKPKFCLLKAELVDFYVWNAELAELLMEILEPGYHHFNQLNSLFIYFGGFHEICGPF